MLIVLKRLLREQDGATLVEYALLVLFIGVICLAAITLLGSEISSFFSAASATI